MAVRMTWPKVIGVAILYMVVSQIILTLGAIMDMNYYMDPNYFPVWSKFMMPSAGPPPLEFTVLSLVFNFITGLLFALVYAVVRPSVPGRNWKNKGLMYGFLVFLLAGLLTTMMLIIMINLPLGLLLSWLLQMLVVYVIAGVVAARYIK